MQKDVILERTDNHCYYCGDILNCQTMTEEHLFPRSLGGKSTLINLVASCQCCNNYRGNILIEPQNYDLIRVRIFFKKVYNDLKKRKEYHQMINAGISKEIARLKLIENHKMWFETNELKPPQRKHATRRYQTSYCNTNSLS